MKNFYIISPKVDGQSVSGYIEEMFDKHIVMMGWPEDEPYGRMFKDMSIGDYVVVGRGANWQKEVFFAGEIISDSYNHDGVQCRKLCNFVDLRGVKNLFSIENSGGESKNPHKAISKLKPESLPADKKVYEFIKSKIEMNKYNFILVQILKNNYNLILTGAPGTGKTYLAHEIAAIMLQKNTWAEVENDTNLASHVGFVQFHPSYDYTDFVEGLRPTIQGNTPFELLPGIFKTFCEEALKKGYKNDGNGKYETSEGELVAVDNAKPYIFIIDEINRGEMSKIFGELFFSIDPGYRGKKGKVQTQYANMEKNGNEFDKALSNDKTGQFFVPKNVYIIGTMNDIDRSVESMDFAMRRRFAFKEVKADSRVEMINESNALKSYFEDICTRMHNLNLCILTIQGLSSAYQIGASYYLKLKNYLEDDKLTDSSWENLWENHIYGLLFEYLRGMPDIDKQLLTLQKAYNMDEKYEEQDGVVKKSNH